MRQQTQNRQDPCTADYGHKQPFTLSKSHTPIHTSLRLSPIRAGSHAAGQNTHARQGGAPGRAANAVHTRPTTRRRRRPGHMCAYARARHFLTRAQSTRPARTQRPQPPCHNRQHVRKSADTTHPHACSNPQPLHQHAPMYMCGEHANMKTKTRRLSESSHRQVACEGI